MNLYIAAQQQASCGLVFAFYPSFIYNHSLA